MLIMSFMNSEKEALDLPAQSSGWLCTFAFITRRKQVLA